MKRAATLFAIAGLMLILPATGIHAEGKTTLTGEFVWDGGGTSGDLEAVFTPTKTAGQWDVAFNFEFRGKPHTYRGTAEGNLSSGDLEGKVQNEDKRRTFTFSGAIAEGKFSGTHVETTGGRNDSMGTLTLGI